MQYVLFKSWLKVAIRKTDNSILVEGNIDVIICTRFRHENVLKFGRKLFFKNFLCQWVASQGGVGSLLIPLRNLEG